MSEYLTRLRFDSNRYLVFPWKTYLQIDTPKNRESADDSKSPVPTPVSEFIQSVHSCLPMSIDFMIASCSSKNSVRKVENCLNRRSNCNVYDDLTSWA